MDWSPAQDGHPGIGSLITYQATGDIILFRLPLHRKGQEVWVTVYPHDHITCRLVCVGDWEEMAE